jgi:hypothetical protein
VILLLLACEGGLFGPSEEELLAEDNDADGFSENEGDCDDDNPSVFPDNEELCDGLDNDCDVLIDETVAGAFFLDVDDDGYGGDTFVLSCTQPAGYVPTDGDCDDEDPSVNPEGVEDGCDNVDDDCDGTVDEGFSTAFYVDGDEDGYGNPDTEQLACESPGDAFVENDFDCDDDDPAVNPLAADVCNDTDDDCDGELDEDPDLFVYADVDGDGFGDAAVTQLECSPSEGWSSSDEDCDDTDPELNPNTLWYSDDDGDGYGGGTDTLNQCPQPSGFVRNVDDCDDLNPYIFPGAEEVCDGVDTDCDSTIDEGSFTTFYLDQDNDTYGGTSTTEACAAPTNYVANSDDCDDTDSGVNPGEAEVCDSVDQDCDGDVDEGVGTTYYTDADADGWGLSSSSTVACALPSGYSAYDGDCNDGNSAINPDATESCNSADDDCDGDTDEGVTTTYYLDDDADTYGLSTSTTEDCTEPSGYASVDGDCDDTDTSVNPGATEVCDDGIDNDCDGSPGSCGVFGSATLSLDTSYDARWLGEGSGNSAGEGVALGDVDGDGNLDVLIGAPDHTSGASYSGTVYINYGFTTASGGLGSADDEILGSTSNGSMGNALTTGDLNGDGTDDIIVSAENATANGRIYTIHGPTTTANLSSVYSAYYVGDTYSRCCDALVSRFDMDGDGNEDFIAGNEAAYNSSGQVYLFYGGSTGALTPDSTWSGEATSDYLGTIAVEDVTGDGTPDILMGAIYNDQLAYNGGSVYLVHGPATTSFTVGAGTEDLRIRGDSASIQTGAAVGAGDVDGDGNADILLTADRVQNTTFAEGAAFVFWGPKTGVTKTGKADVTVYGVGYANSLGSGIAGEDLDGDGQDDLIVMAALNNGNGGAEYYKGKTYIFLGPVSGSYLVTDADLVIEGAKFDAAGLDYDFQDYDGDGDIDYLFGAPYNTSSGNYTGAAYLKLGGGI